ncbi:lactosylceramide 4-alpha-galactosyltransferase [Amborella trichopoda]|uniref:Alpha 1,4-glycosyltransferase domain-containing protein n=1 Tax=Amborella trichopoda TaxID=13333 RepID=W1PIG2_AMBTC|nr:lactosylceramide 4-alpha-galactosyltransferase [Amborella trichopoda]ERN09757.1 hypothetical protein AMTR_s00029p00235780 [Amborella trichopoda]|eukprot:XP_006848176.3 lactosylceramide 4-alpha-galactosyltransferase [Amborella trichopoda]
MINFRQPTSFRFSLFTIILLTFFSLLLFLSAFSNFSLIHFPVGLNILPESSVRQPRLHFPILLSIEKETHVPLIKGSDHFLSPLNVSQEERMLWFKENQFRFKIIQDSPISKRFSLRARKFFGVGCELRFFMTWISPAKAFGHREFLSLESLFKAHDKACLLIVSQSMDSRHGKLILRPFREMDFRVLAVTPDLPFLFRNTPAETWFDDLKGGKIDPGEIPFAQNLSNLLRLSVLYKFGGIYLDTDVIVMKKFSNLRNSIGAQTMSLEPGQWSRLNNAMLIFDENHPLLLEFIGEFALTFNGNRWGHNGPYLVSRVASRVHDRPGFNFTVLPPMAFYPVDWIKIGGFFQRPKNPRFSKWVSAKLRQLQQETYAIHLWNRESRKLRIEKGSILGHIISKCCIFCKHVYAS